MITFVSCWYNFKAKFNKEIYYDWIDNMLTNVNNYNLVIYTDDDGYLLLHKYEKSNIKIIIKDHTSFYNYRYNNCWINNHSNNHLLKNKVDWKVNMLWSEKIGFVRDAYEEKYFDTEFYGWCDIGYFRNRHNDTSKEMLRNWPEDSKISELNKDKIHYGLINNNPNYMNQLFKLIIDKNEMGLPKTPIPPNQLSVAAGFFILHKDKIQWWFDTYDTKLKLYFNNGYLVKDDQVIVIDCIFSNMQRFQLHKETNPKYDNWFMFQRLLM